MGDNDLTEFPPHIGKFTKLEIVSSCLFELVARYSLSYVVSLCVFDKHVLLCVCVCACIVVCVCACIVVCVFVHVLLCVCVLRF